jgi:hypothetical protein
VVRTTSSWNVCGSGSGVPAGDPARCRARDGAVSKSVSPAAYPAIPVSRSGVNCRMSGRTADTSRNRNAVTRSATDRSSANAPSVTISRSAVRDHGIDTKKPSPACATPSDSTSPQVRSTPRFNVDTATSIAPRTIRNHPISDAGVV